MVATVVKVVPSVLRSIRNPASVVELSVHVIVAALVELEVTVTSVGASGGGVTVLTDSVPPVLLMLEKTRVPLPGCTAATALSPPD